MLKKVLVFFLCVCAGMVLTSEAQAQRKGKVQGSDPVKFGSPKHTVQNKGAPSPDNRIPLGYLSAYGVVTVGKSECRVDEVIGGGLASKGGLEVGDLITGVNGTPITQTFSLREGDGGAGPQEALGYGLEDALKTKNKKLTLTVTRNGKPKELTIQLPKDMEAFSATFPFNCERSEKMLEALVEKLIERKGDRRNIGGEVQCATAGLGILGSYDLKKSAHVRDMAHWMAEQEPGQGGLPAWPLNYGTSYLCEYYLATKDKSVLAAIEKRLAIHEDWISDEPGTRGRVGHGKAVGYKGAGINIIGSHHYMNFGLINRCGIKVDEKPWDNVEQWLLKCQAGEGQIGYISASGPGQTSGITGKAALGFMLRDKMDIALKCTNCWVLLEGNEQGRGLRSVWNAHACSAMGFTWSCSAMAALRTDKAIKNRGVADGMRVYMDYWKWYLSLGQAPAGSDVIYYYIPSEGNCGGDGYLNYDLIGHASKCVMLATMKQALFVHGNTKQDWYNRRELLRRSGLLEKVERLCRQIDDLEKQERFRDAYAKLMELQKVDSENDYMFEKPRNWGTLANNEINRSLPAVVDKNYYAGYKTLDQVLKKFGPEVSPRAVFFSKQIESSPIAKRQKLDGPKADAVVRDVYFKRITSEVGLRRLSEVIKPHEHTGFHRYYLQFINQWKAELEEAAEGVPLDDDNATAAQ